MQPTQKLRPDNFNKKTIKNVSLFNNNAFLKTLIKNRILLIMLLPAFIYYLIFSYLPMAGIILAFKNFNYRQGIFGSPWIGLENFRFFFIGGKAISVTFNTFAFNLVFMAVNTFFDISVAIFLSELTSKYFKRISQSMLFFPYFISWVVVGAFIYNIFNFEFGSLNTFLRSVGMDPVNVYTNIGAWKYILVASSLWKNIGYGSIVYLAAITGIDHEMYEAADIDGASIFQKIRFITLPSIIPQIIVLSLLAVGRIFRGNFAMFFQVTGNNPMLYDSTDVIDTFVFRSLTQLQEFGMASAVGLYQSVLCFIIINITNYLVKRYEREYALY